jgi:pimeloyl-ACP methyl ester carboxylesterase
MTTDSMGIRDRAVIVGDGRLTIHFKTAGSGPPLVYFHALGGLRWSPLLDALADSFTVYAVEHPGTSPGDHRAIYEVESFTELLLGYEEALGELGLERPIGVGVSFGGMVAADLAATFPTLFSKLVLCCPIGLWRDDAPIPLVELISGSPEEVGKALFLDPDSEAAKEMMAMPGDPEEIPAHVAQVTWNIGCTSKFAWPIADHGLRRRLHRIAVPTLILWGRQDALVPLAYSEDFAAGIAGARVVVLDEAGHEVQADQPEATREAITTFLAGTS